nr:hypothetical protein [uncultured Limnohabitans sp.]
MFEHYSKPLIPRAAYHRRLVGAVGLALLLIGVSLLAGMFGYHEFETMSWVDAYLSAAMILSGMGPVGEPLSMAGKLFSGTYALYSGFVALICVGVLGAPVLHRFLHRFHFEEDVDA